MTTKSDSGPELDSGAAIYANASLDYHDTGRANQYDPVAGAQFNRRTPPAHAPGPGVAENDPGLVAAFEGAYALIVEVGDKRQLRRRLVMSLAAAETARERAEARGLRCRVALVRLELVAELERDTRSGGEVSGMAQGL